jgi:hypothetical protein
MQRQQPHPVAQTRQGWGTLGAEASLKSGLSFSQQRQNVQSPGNGAALGTASGRRVCEFSRSLQNRSPGIRNALGQLGRVALQNCGAVKPFPFALHAE